MLFDLCPMASIGTG